LRAGGIEKLNGSDWDAEAILETVLLIAWYRFRSCVSTGLSVSADFPPAPVAISSDGVREEATEAEIVAHVFSPALVSDAASSALRDLYGFVPNVFRCQAARPKVIEAETGALQLLLSDERHLSRTQKEQIIIAVSAANRNLYFVTLHSEILSTSGVSQDRIDGIAQDHRTAALDQADLELLHFAVKLATEPTAFGPDDRAKLTNCGFTEEQILEAVVTTGFTQFLNAVQFGTGAAPDFEPRIALPARPPEITNLFDSNYRPTEGGVVFDPDADAVAKVRSGDSDAFEVLVTRHSRRVYRTLLGILGSPEEARDAVQDTFLKAYQHLEKFEGRSKFSTWLVSIASNTGLQMLRERKPLQSLDDDAADGDENLRPRQIRAWTDNPEQLYSKSETRALVEQGVLKLPAKYRMVLMLRDIEQLSIEEAAAALNLGIPALKSRHLRGRLMLREALTPHFAESAKGGTA
jgi:RNA polymerase sigma-70 factor (ECF subfamily)